MNLVLAGFVLGVTGRAVLAEDAPAKPGTYMGREIARTMHYSASDWLVRHSREREESAAEMIRELRLRPGMTVADVGCGIGYHSLTMARQVQPGGMVLCVDIQPEMLEKLTERAKAAGVTNFTPILGKPGRPHLPEDRVDLILLVDAYHEFGRPAAMLRAMHRSLKADGVMVLLEYRAEDDTVPIKPEHKMSRTQILKEMRANDFVLARSYDDLPWQHMLFFKKAGATNPAGRPDE